MSISAEHTFHIPVLGIGYSIDTPVKVAKYGISSVLSIGDDDLLEKMRKYYCEKTNETYIPITKKEEDSRARRITAYLNLIQQLVNNQFEALKDSEFAPGTEITKYFELLPEYSVLKKKYNQMLSATDDLTRNSIQQWLRDNIVPGSIDVNIMTKLDKFNYTQDGEQLPVLYNDAHAAIRGFAESKVSGSVILSAGMNPRLFSYMESISAFNPDPEGRFNKKIVIKVSDFRSAIIQGKFLAKKGIWVSEYRIESGLNCGGHAFATDGYLLGPILEEFKTRKSELLDSISLIYAESLAKKNIIVDPRKLNIKLTVQGGVGLSSEQEFLLRYYNIDSVGWGSPFLLVPEVMNVDEVTLQKLADAGEEDIYLSRTSPLGVLFNNLKLSTKEEERLERTAQGKFGSPCTKNYLKFNTEFTEKPICTASIEFQKKKIKELDGKQISGDEYNQALFRIIEKECLCEGLTSPAMVVNNISNHKISTAASVCPGPNLAYFSKIASLREMVDHIYGRINLITDESRPNMFVKELGLYIDYFQNLVEESIAPLTEQTEKFLKTFRENLLNGIDYYKKIIPLIIEETEVVRDRINFDLLELEKKLV